MSKVIYRTQATAHGGRAGHIDTPDHHLSVKLSVPGELGGAGGVGTNPEQLFAAGYAACFQSAIGSVARREKVQFGNSEVTAHVGLARDDVGYALDVDLHVRLPGLSREQAEHLVHEAHRVCPYSRAVSGNVNVRISVVE
jgi:Ohr subfamily peroxiredoxin